MLCLVDWTTLPGNTPGQREVLLLLPLCEPHTLLDTMNARMKPVEARSERAVLSIFAQVRTTHSIESHDHSVSVTIRCVME